MRAQHHPSPCLFVLDYLTDWSAVNVQLFNFHAARASVCGCDTVHDSSEYREAALSNIICWSRNRGQCVAPFASCRFAHKCSSFFGQHRVGDYPGDLSSKLSTKSKHPPCLSPTFLQQVQAILNSLLWLCHSHLEGGRVSLLYWYFLIHTGLCLVKLVVWFDCVPFWLACSFMENCFPRMC